MKKIQLNLISDRTEEAIERYYDFYQKNHQQYVEDNPEIKEMLQYLKTQGYKLGLVTGKSRRSLDYSLAALQMKHLFDVDIAGDEVAKHKPDPEGVLKAISALGVDGSEAMFLGDSDFDMSAAKGAGVLSVGVHWLPNVQSKVFKVKPDQYFTSIDAFLKFLQ